MTVPTELSQVAASAEIDALAGTLQLAATHVVIVIAINIRVYNLALAGVSSLFHCDIPLAVCNTVHA